MKYLVRALKYFVYLFIILALLIAVLVLTKVVDGNLSTMFVNGTDSLWQIALVMAVSPSSTRASAIPPCPSIWAAPRKRSRRW